jgi:very-short-patch-repair endonuclease
MKAENIPFERSFANHPKSKFWSSKNELKPTQVTISSPHKKFWFDCEICNHIFEISTNNITNNKQWCPYCVNQKLCEDKNCKECFEKSFASHPKSKFWSTENKLKSRQVFKSSPKKYIFKCICSHIFDISLNNINNTNKPQWCPYCANQKLCENENCKSCFDKSFASHIKSEFWSTKNKLQPRQVFKSSGKKYILKCNICNHDFNMTLNDISSNNRWCPHCKHKTELKLFNWLNEKNFNVISQVKFDWCKNKTYLPFDFVLESLKLIIELDGAQHFRQVSNWKSSEHNKKNDDFKNKSALSQGYRMIRICQEIVLADKEDWENELIKAINTKEKLIKIGSVYIK